MTESPAPMTAATTATPGSPAYTMDARRRRGAVRKDRRRRPRRSRADVDVDADEVQQLQPSLPQANLGEALRLEKQRYPGASTWAVDEERLFEILFLRQDLPLLPSHWDVDFRGVPMAASIFQASDECPPVVYAHSRKEFQATMALMRLIDLTANVRTTCQSGLRHKAPAHIKKTIDNFVAWAADDGGYKHLDYVPNLIVDVVDADREHEQAITIMERRMRALARVQRESLRLDRDPAFWNVDQQPAPSPGASKGSLLVHKYALDQSRGRGQYVDENMSPLSEAQAGTGIRPSSESPKADHDTTHPTAPPGDDTKDLQNTDADAHTDLDADPDATIVAPVQYRRQPPVVYGLFILGTSVILLTVDSAKGETAYVSFLVDLHFLDRHQSVWNALTVAIPVCRARDELLTRLDDFDSARVLDESDPDA